MDRVTANPGRRYLNCQPSDATIKKTWFRWSFPPIWTFVALILELGGTYHPPMGTGVRVMPWR